MNLNKGYTTMQGSDNPSTIDNTNQTQIAEIEADMTTIETDVTANESATALNTTHRSSDGKNHSDVVLNNAHRAGDGSDHADVASNTASRHTQNTDTNLGTLGTKATPIDADKVIQRNSADSDNLVTSTWTQIKAFLKTYFDTLYGSLSDVASNTTHSTGDGSDHADVATNTTHRGLTNNPHSVDIDDVTPTTTKGDIIVENGSNAVRLPVGTDTQVLSANSAEATGLQWVSAGTPGAHASSHEDGGADEIDLSGLVTNGLSNYTAVTPTYSSTSNGIDTISFAGVDVTTEFKRGAKVKVTSDAGTHFYDCIDSSFSTNTTVKLAGETSVSGTITAISYSYSDNPQGYKKGEDYYRMNAKRTSNQTVNDSVSTKVQLDTEVFDTNSNYDNVTNYRWTCPVSGIYTVSLGGVMYDSTNVMVSAFASIYKNGVEDQRSHFQPGETNATRLPANLTKLMKLNRGDYIEFFVNIDTNDSGTAEIALDPFMSIMFDGIAEA